MGAHTLLILQLCSSHLTRVPISLDPDTMLVGKSSFKGFVQGPPHCGDKKTRQISAEKSRTTRQAVLDLGAPPRCMTFKSEFKGFIQPEDMYKFSNKVQVATSVVSLELH